MTNLDIKYQWQSQIALLIASAVLTLMLVNSVKANEETTSPRSLSIIAADDIVLGNKEAQIILIEYFSPTCHHCSSIHQKIFPTLKEKYIDTGKIAYVMREFIGNKQDLDASILARCNGNKDQYFKIIETVLATQEIWAYSWNYRQELSKIGDQVGVEQEQYTKCLAEELAVTTLMENTKLAATTPSFVGTPSFFINGDLINVKTEKQFFAAIEGAVESNSSKISSEYLDESQITERKIKYSQVAEDLMAYFENIANEVNRMALNNSGI